MDLVTSAAIKEAAYQMRLDEVRDEEIFRRTEAMLEDRQQFRMILDCLFNGGRYSNACNALQAMQQDGESGDFTRLVRDEAERRAAEEYDSAPRIRSIDDDFED